MNLSCFTVNSDHFLGFTSRAQTCPAEYVGLACLTAAVVGVMQILASVMKLGSSAESLARWARAWLPGFLVTFLGHPASWRSCNKLEHA